MSARYTHTAISLHWLIAIGIIGMFCLGLYMTNLPLSPHKLRVYSWHKWAGVTLFVLILIRLGWRATHPAPPLPATMPSPLRAAATAAHGLLYTLMLVIPLSGWLMSSALGFQTVWFGVLPLPNLLDVNRELGQRLEFVHATLNYTLAALVALHALAAIKHHLIDRDDVLTRMLPCAALLVLCVAAGLPRQAQAAQYSAIDPAASRITFTYKQMEVGMSGKFAKFDADLNFDPANPAAAQAKVTVTLSSIDAGSPEATDSATNKDWLDAAAHPVATFELTQAKALGDNKFEATGKLTIKGVAQTVSSVFTVTTQGQQAIIDGTLPIKRSAFGVGAGEWADPSVVSDEVQINYHLAAGSH